MFNPDNSYAFDFGGRFHLGKLGTDDRLLRSPQSQSSTYHTGTPPVAPLCGLESGRNRLAKLK
jgi:hypothetical protein